MVAAPEGVIYKNKNMSLNEKMVKYYLSYQDSKFHIYTTTQKIDDKQFLVIPLRTEDYRWNVLCVIPYSIILEKADLVNWQVLFTMLTLLSIGLLFTVSLYRMMQKNLEIIENGMKQYERGDYSKLPSPSSYDEIGLLILQFNYMGLKINELNELTRKEQEEKQRLQYMIMEAQINPHFLYNTLGSLKWLAYEKEQDEIARMADAIINLLRFTVKNTSKFIPLREEIDYLKHYIYIQKARYENAFTEEFLVIGFILQPFIENSILYGLDNSRKDGRLRITAKAVDNVLHLIIEDNGRGMVQEKLEDLLKKLDGNKTEKYKGFNGIGITNIILRMKMIYAEDFLYKIESEAGKGTRVILMIPRKGVDE